MKNYNSQEVKKCYNLSAREYSKQFLHELDQKPLDRYLLDRFSASLQKKSIVLDFGCGSGQTTKHLYDLRNHNIIGLDFAEKVVSHAKEVFPEIQFDVDNMLKSKYRSASAHGVMAFYAIVHFTYNEISKALSEWERLLVKNGKVLFSFHIGTQSISIMNFLNVEGAHATWNFFNVDRIVKIIRLKELRIDEVIIRYPYENVEHPSKRCYIMLTRK